MTGLNTQVYYICFQFEVSDTICNEVLLNLFILNTFINILLILANIHSESQDDILLYIKKFTEYKYLNKFRLFSSIGISNIKENSFLEAMKILFLLSQLYLVIYQK